MTYANREYSFHDFKRSCFQRCLNIGEQSLVERTTRTEFQKTGVFHILVVSGMNVGMLAVFIFWALLAGLVH